jgi:glycosyltransferase involved in cell wall biosynthesis
MCQAFALNGHKITLIAMPFGKALHSQEIADYYGVKNMFAIKLIKRMPIPGKNILYGVMSTLYTLIIRPDIVYGRDLIGCCLSALFGIKTIIEMHYPYSWLNRFYKIVFSNSISNKYLLRVVVISRALEKMYAEDLLFAKKKLLVAHDAADHTPLTEKMSLATNESNAIHVGYCGSLYKGRGIDIVITLAQRIPEYEFHVAGGTNQEVETWKKMAEEKGVKNTHFHGFLLPGITHKFRNACDILLAPYQARMHVSGGEGDIRDFFSPIKLFEYMSSRKPIIISKLSVLSEILCNNLNAIMVEADNIDEWENALRILQVPEKRSALGERAYSDFCINYTWDKRARSVLQDI